MKKLTLNGITSAPASKSSHPIVDVTDPEAKTLLTQWAENNPQFTRLKRVNETLAKQLAPHIKRLFFARFAGITPESSTILADIGGRTVKLITKAVYSKSVEDESGLVAVLGKELVSRFFKQATVLKLDLDLVPPDKQEAFANAVLALASEMGVSEAISAKQCIQPVAGFHEARTTVLTPEQNMALDSVLSISAYPQL